MASNPSSETVIQSLGATWSQRDLGAAFDVETLSVLSELDPTGANGVVSEVLLMFQESLDPVFERLDHHRNGGSRADIRFEAHKLKSAAAQIGALRLAAACSDVLKKMASGGCSPADSMDGEFGVLVDALVTEIVRVQRQLRRLLQP